ncbi:LysR family transcriptional regulator [Demequina capsici]|uniref:LysR family transcriptional regulator n=1 Tax=Demequina capsici TaxID=3075620 RepID=A0AA96FCN1_9MICO|nr:LysR family transcriptional regulator [Demequina sp. PMTSA13]WNM27232.1 LysR family transcriptional regulator [Demequina sp. PMTSA13]
MDEYTLRTFLSLAETENTRDTAAFLRVNQSNVSRTLARLEAEVGTSLFTRHGRRLELNATGAAFRADAAAVLDAIDQARRHAEALARDARVLRVGFLHSLARWMVPDVIQRLRTLHPDLRITLRQGFSRDLYRWIEADAIDVVLANEPPSAIDGVEWSKLHEEQLCLAFSDTHPLSAIDRPTVKDLAGQDFIGFSRITELHRVIAGLLADQGVEVNVTFESSEIDTMRTLVAGGLAASVLPRTPGRDDDGITYVPLDPPLVRELGIAWRSGTPAAEIAESLVDAL